MSGGTGGGYNWGASYAGIGGSPNGPNGAAWSGHSNPTPPGGGAGYTITRIDGTSVGYYGYGGSCMQMAWMGSGGGGGRVVSTVNVTPGQVLSITIGGAGIGWVQGTTKAGYDGGQGAALIEYGAGI